MAGPVSTRERYSVSVGPAGRYRAGERSAMGPVLRLWLLLVALLFVVCGVAAADDESTPVFRSDVSMGRIDALVMDRSQHPIGGLRQEDFLLRQDGKLIP